MNHEMNTRYGGTRNELINNELLRMKMIGVLGHDFALKAVLGRGQPGNC